MATSTLVLRIYHNGAWQTLSLPKRYVNGSWVVSSIYRRSDGRWVSAEELGKIQTSDGRNITTNDDRVLLCYV